MLSCSRFDLGQFVVYSDPNLPGRNSTAEKPQFFNAIDFPPRIPQKSTRRLFGTTWYNLLFCHQIWIGRKRLQKPNVFGQTLINHATLVSPVPFHCLCPLIMQGSDSRRVFVNVDGRTCMLASDCQERFGSSRATLSHTPMDHSVSAVNYRPYRGRA